MMVVVGEETGIIEMMEKEDVGVVAGVEEEAEVGEDSQETTILGPNAITKQTITREITQQITQQITNRQNLRPQMNIDPWYV